MPQVILCRFGELFLKSGNRRRFEGILHRNMNVALSGLAGVRVEPVHGRVLVHVPDEATAEEAAVRLSRVFGLVSLSIATITAPTMEAMYEVAVTLARKHKDATGAQRFKVVARRTNKTFPHRSLEIAAMVGGQIVTQVALTVDVRKPELVVGVELTEKRAFVYAGNIMAPGGLPVGVSGRGLLLLSGGIDSPVAGWLAAKRGLAIDAVYFHSPPYIGEKSRDKVLSLGRQMARWQALETVTIINFTDIQKRLREAGAPEIAVILYRRMMMRIADAVADRRNADTLITGENLGQVASQTIQNLTVIESAARRVVLRPLITYDKMETTAIARRLGTLEISELPFEDCCSLFVPHHPSTAARAVDADRAEAKLDLDAAIAEAIATSETVVLGAVSKKEAKQAARVAAKDAELRVQNAEGTPPVSAQ